jgi:DNA-binding MarR family transcriptional regulator
LTQLRYAVTLQCIITRGRRVASSASGEGNADNTKPFNPKTQSLFCGEQSVSSVASPTSVRPTGKRLCRETFGLRDSRSCHGIDTRQVGQPGRYCDDYGRSSREGPIRLTALAAKEGVSQPSMTQLIQRLARAGLVTRLADPGDGRAALIGITRDGQALLDDRKRLRRERLALLLATLTAEEESALWLSARVALPVLHQLAANADCPPNSAGVHPASAETAGTGSIAQRKVFG